MDATWIEVAGLTIRAPVTAGTNLLLTGQCLLYYRSLRSSRAPAATLWGAFFLLMSFATLAGVVKHGFRHQLTENQLILVLWMSNLRSGVSTYLAQRATAAVYGVGLSFGPWFNHIDVARVLLGVSFYLILGGVR